MTTWEETLKAACDAGKPFDLLQLWAKWTREVGGVFARGRWPGGLNFEGYFDGEAEAREWCAANGIVIAKLWKAIN